MPRAIIAAQPKVTERAFQADVIGLARMLGYRARHDAATNAPRRCWKCGAPSRGPRNPKGGLDLVLWRPKSRTRSARFIHAELKASDGVLSPEQRDEIASLNAADQETYVWVYGPTIMQEIADVLGSDRRP